MDRRRALSLAVACCAGLAACAVAAAATRSQSATGAIASPGPRIVVEQPAVRAGSSVAAAAPVGLVARAAGPAPTPSDAIGWPHPNPLYTLPGASTDACDSQRVPHPSGFAAMGGTGTDTVTQADGTSATYPTAVRHVPLQVVCQNGTSSGDVAVEVVIFPSGSDASAFNLTVGPSGLVVSSVTPGHGAATIPVGQRIAGWPGGCGTLRLAGAGPHHDSVNDTLCFSSAGQLTHAELHEHSIEQAGATRQLDVNLDTFPAG